MKFLKKILKASDKNEKMFLSRLNKLTTINTLNVKLYQTAFTHGSSNRKDENGNSINFERLEFLGDSIIDLVISEFLFNQFPNVNEGTLTIYRAKIVSRENLNNIGKKLQLIQLLDIEGNVNLGENINGNLLEALIGAIFLDKGYEKCSQFILKKVLKKHFDISNLNNIILSYKGLILEWGQKNKKNIKFKTKFDSGLDPKSNYSTSVFLNDKLIFKSREISKKKSEEKAARRAYYALKIKSKA